MGFLWPGGYVVWMYFELSNVKLNTLLRLGSRILYLSSGDVSEHSVVTERGKQGWLSCGDIVGSLWDKKTFMFVKNADPKRPSVDDTNKFLYDCHISNVDLYSKVLYMLKLAWTKDIKPCREE